MASMVFATSMAKIIVCWWSCSKQFFYWLKMMHWKLIKTNPGDSLSNACQVSCQVLIKKPSGVGGQIWWYFSRNIFLELVLCDGCEFQVILAVGQLRWLCFFDHFCFLIMISVSFDVPCLLHVPIKLWRWLIVLMGTRYILTMQCSWLGRWSRGGSTSGARELLELRWLIHLYSVHIYINIWTLDSIT